MRLFPGRALGRALVVVLLATCGGLIGPAEAQRLPVRRYTSDSGLAHDRIDSLSTDSRGFLWFSTFDGLSRFDGRRFTSYGFPEGLLCPRLTDLVEAADGSYWIATAGGSVSRFEPAGLRPGSTTSRFVTYPLENDSEAVTTCLLQDHQGRLWVGSLNGLYRLDSTSTPPPFRAESLGLGLPVADRVEIERIAEDPSGSLWVGSDHGLLRRLPSGRWLQYHLNRTVEDRVWGLVSDPRGRIWAGHRNGLFVLLPEAPEIAENVPRPTAASCRQAGSGEVRLPTRPGELCHYTTAGGLGHNNVQALLSHGTEVWIGTGGGGLTHFDGQRFHAYGERNGIDADIGSLALDAAGYLWLGTPGQGALRLGNSGFETFLPADGLGQAEVMSVFETLAGELVVLGPRWTLSWLQGDELRSLQPRLPPEMVAANRGRWEIRQDHLGEWWAATPEGLYRFPAVSHLEDLAEVPPKAIYTTRDGLPDNLISRLFEDSRGDVWVSSYHPPVMLARWERATGRIRTYGHEDGLPLDNWANVFAEDALGQVWLGLHNGGLARFAGGRFELFSTADGIPRGLQQGIYRDASNRLWFATSAGGAARLDQPGAKVPRFVSYTMNDKLASNNLRCFAEDGDGNLFLGTARGIDRLHLVDGRVESFQAGAGLPSGEVTAAYRDHHGTLWFGTRNGLVRLRPGRRTPAPPPQMWLQRLRISGVDRARFELGVRSLGNLVLGPNERDIEVEYFALDFASDTWLGYQHRFAGGNDTWSPPSEQRTLNARLAPGRYRLEVRAVRGDGAVSREPASLELKLLPPVWQRGWFLTLATFALTAAVLLLYRLRVRRLLELERVRTRIATDLHDDIGASLSRIAILSEVVKRGIAGTDSQAHGKLNEIADSARGLIDTMSDIVWAIDPRKDRGIDLVRRIRSFASDVLEPQGIRWQFQAPAELEALRLPHEARRHLLLIAKEAIHNAVRHAEASEVVLGLTVTGRELRLEIRDNGIGFDPAAPATPSGRGGHGLPNLAARCRELGGQLEIDSEPGHGTHIRVRLPL